MSCEYAASAGGELRIHERFEGFHLRRDGLAERVFADDGVGGLQAVTGDAHDSGLTGRYAALIDQLFRDARCYAAGRFRKDTFRFGENFYRSDNFRIGDVFRPAAGFTNLFDGVTTVGGIADRQRARNGFRFLWLPARGILCYNT